MKKLIYKLQSKFVTQFLKKHLDFEYSTKAVIAGSMKLVKEALEQNKSEINLSYTFPVDKVEKLVAIKILISDYDENREQSKLDTNK